MRAIVTGGSSAFECDGAIERQQHRDTPNVKLLRQNLRSRRVLLQRRRMMLLAWVNREREEDEFFRMVAQGVSVN